MCYYAVMFVHASDLLLQLAFVLAHKVGVHPKFLEKLDFEIPIGSLGLPSGGFRRPRPFGSGVALCSKMGAKNNLKPPLWVF